jgi:hypothetical protein
VAEREGFEPPIQLPVCRISSAVLSTAQPPLRYHETTTIAELAGTKACSQPSCHASRLEGLLTPALRAPSTRGTGSWMILPVALREGPPWRASFAALYRAQSSPFRRSGRKARQEIPAAPIDRGGHGCHLIKEAGICTPPDALGPPMDRARFATALPFGARAARWVRSFDLAQGRSEL